MWQRQEPDPADFDAIYALTLPLLMKGIPVQFAQLDRAGEPGYLDPYRVLLVSFDAMKPQTRAEVDGLIAWVKAGGHLLEFGGADPYNDLALWWQDAGCASPHEYLLKALGLNPMGTISRGAEPVTASFEPVAATDYAGRNLANLEVLKLDVSRFARRTGAVFVKFEDAIPGDGWGPWIGSLRLIGTRNGKPLGAIVKPGTPLEAALIASDTGSGYTGTARFVDGAHVLIYRFEFDAGTPAAIEVQVGNQYRISAAPAPPVATHLLTPAGACDFAGALPDAPLLGAKRAYAYPALGGQPLVVAGSGVVIAEATVGKGSVLVCGLPAATFAKSPATDDLLRALVRHVCQRGEAIAYREQERIGIRRGDYQVLRTFAGTASVEEPTIDLMSADLAVSSTRTLGPHDLLILKHLPRQTGPAPVIAASSTCIEWQQAMGEELRLITSGAAGVPGVMRLVTGGKGLTVSAQDASGNARGVRVEAQGTTALLRFDSQPQGLGMRIRAW
jgi:hypothetical protein